MSAQDKPSPLYDVPTVLPDLATYQPLLVPVAPVASIPAAIPVESAPSRFVVPPPAVEEVLPLESKEPPSVLAAAKPSPASETKPPLPHVRKVAQNDSSLGADSGAFWREVQNRVDAEKEKPRSDEHVCQLTQRLREALACSPPRLLAFDERRSGSGDQFVQVDRPLGAPVWFIGDLHGDLLAYVALTHFIATHEGTGETGGHYKICFLGDIVDRGPYDIPLLCTLLHGFLEQPGRFAFVVGNHDDGIYRDQASKEWRSTVDPSDFCDRLNHEIPSESPIHELVGEAVKFFSQAPRVLLFPGGLLVAHGGVPHVDRLEQLNKPEDLNGTDMLSDFVWTRLHESARRKVPNRTTRGCSLGFEDFNSFCDRAETILDRPITAMLRGHDHVAERYLIHERYPRRSVVTINAMCRKQSGDVFGPYERKPVAVRWREGHPLELFQLEIPAWLIEHFYPRSSASHEEPTSEPS